MREAIGGTWLFQIVIFFVLLFTAYLCISINYSRAFKVKNELIYIIEREKGINDSSLEQITNYLNDVGHRSTGKCENANNETGEWYGFNGTEFSNVPNANYYLCVKKISRVLSNEEKIEIADSSYYRVKVFFQLDIPIFGSMFNLRVNGDTALVYYPDDRALGL